MAQHSSEPKGLTRVIYETLEGLTMEVASEGIGWSDQLLAEVEAQVRSRLAPPKDSRAGLVFDMVFKRSFGEAKELLLATLPPSQIAPNGSQAYINMV